MRAVSSAGSPVGRIVALALAEDLGEEGDITSRAVLGAGNPGAAGIFTNVACVVSGMAAAAEVCRQVDESLSWLPLVEDGAAVPAGAEIARLEGELLSILAAERTMLNFLARLSGIATFTRRFVEALEGLPTRVAATRKTAPGLRALEKEAVVHGGGEPHRAGLYDAVLVKDNHIAAAGGIEAAVAAVRKQRGGEPIEVEVENDEQLAAALEAGVERVLLDNMDPEEVRRAVEQVAGRAVVEASGGIGLENARAFAEAGADVISVGALTMAAPAVDLTLEVQS